MKIEDKRKVVEEVKEDLDRAKVVIVTDYKGLDVAAMNALRRQLRESGIIYRVVKNTLLIRASEDNDVALTKSHFKGPSAIAYSFDDPVAPAKILSEFAKDNEAFDIKAGVLDGSVMGTDDIKALADLPSREVLLGQLLSAMNAVPTSFVRVLAGVPQQMVNLLGALKDQKAAAEG